MYYIDVLYGFVRGSTGKPDMPGAYAQQTFDDAVRAGKAGTGCPCKCAGQDDRNCVWVFHTKEFVQTLRFYAVFPAEKTFFNLIYTVFPCFLQVKGI